MRAFARRARASMGRHVDVGTIFIPWRFEERLVLFAVGDHTRIVVFLQDETEAASSVSISHPLHLLLPLAVAAQSIGALD